MILRAVAAPADHEPGHLMLSTLLLAAALNVGQTPPSLSLPPPVPATEGSPTDKVESKSNDQSTGNIEDTSGGFLKRFLREYPTVREAFPRWLSKPEEKKENGDESES